MVPLMALASREASAGKKVNLPASCATLTKADWAKDKVPPEPFHTLSLWNPVFHLIDGFRYGFTGHADADVMTSAISTGVICVVLVFACWRVFKTGWRMRA
jgi:hypothetical protein